MGAFHRLMLCAGAAATAAAAVSLAPVAADAGIADQLLVCVPARADVADVSIQNLRYGAADGYVWAKANVRLTMRNGSVSEYSVSGEARPIDRQLSPNQNAARFAYPEFQCTVNYAGITGVHDCWSANERRACNVGVTMFGTPSAFAVSLSAVRNGIVKAATVP